MFIITIIPWIGNLFKSIKLPGGYEFTYRDLEGFSQRANEVGLITNGQAGKYSFENISGIDPILAIAGLRIELEKALKELCEGLRMSKGLRPKAETLRPTIKDYIRCLQENNILLFDEIALLNDLIGFLNKAVHGQKLPPTTTNWVLDIGPKLLNTLNEREKAKNKRQ